MNAAPATTGFCFGWFTSATPKHSRLFPMSSLRLPSLKLQDSLLLAVRLCGHNWELGARSQHEQWDDLIRDIWRLAGPDRALPDNQKVEEILARIAGP